MRQNEGTLDRTVRIVGGLAILSLAVVGPQTPWALLGIIPVITGTAGYCPAYKLIGINTCGMRK
jgi:hypothetical protein